MTMTLSPEAARGYLAERDGGFDANVEAIRLGGGVSNHVIKVRDEDNCIVLKQPRPNLNVEEDWPADVDRVHNEATATRVYESILKGVDLDATVPAIQFEDHERHIVGMECAPETTSMWKDDLLDGVVDDCVAEIAGRVLGTVHREAAADLSALAQFASKRPFEQLRIDPYHSAVASRHPDLNDVITAMNERLLGSERTLVHGDFSPKNILVDRESARIWVLDFEVAHRGDPVFDTAFMLNHLYIKSVYNADRGECYRAAARTFFAAYDDLVPWELEAGTVEELGVLMLARVDGKSPVEYLDEPATKETLRSIALRTLTEDVRDLDAFTEIVQAEGP